MRLSYTIALGAAALAATPALAQEPGPFTGGHVEALAGYDHLSVDNGVTENTSDGVHYGVAGGYDFQAGQLIAGIEGELSESTSRVFGFGINRPGDFQRLEADRDIYVGARLGYAIAPATMLYVKGGYTNLRMKSRYDDGLGNRIREGESIDGWRAGAGVEQKFSLFGPSGFVKAEYRYSKYSDLTFPIALPADINRHQIVAGLGIRF